MTTSATMPPEDDLRAVAKGDYSGLSTPILVAAATRGQFEDFIWQEALFCSEVRRFREPFCYIAEHPENKILLLLPDCHRDPRTAAAVEWWLHNGRHAVDLRAPRLACPPRRKKRLGILAMIISLCAVAAWVFSC